MLQRPHSGRRALRAMVNFLAWGGLIFAGGTAGADELFQRFELNPMTYVASQGSANELILQADHAEYHPAEQVIRLKGVRAQMAGASGRKGFELNAERGTIDLESSVFLAEGSVTGRTADGRVLSTEKMKYAQDDGVVSSTAPVHIREGNMAYRGREGFVYEVREGRFRFLGGATLEQDR
jgi:LPS export ABC transporter protein LptC